MYRYGKYLVLLALLVACEVEPVNTPTPSATPGAALRSLSGGKPGTLDEVMANLTGDPSRVWQLVARYRDDVDITVDCSRDDQLIMHRKNRMDLNVGAELCPVEGVVERSRSGSWQMTSEFNLLVTIEDELPFQLKINVLEANRLVISYQESDGATYVESYLRVETAAPSPSAALPAQGTTPALTPFPL
ncbi:MAG: hypothetical protein ACO1RX_19240 [Candidatus Sericytochromatia bacterium]